MKPDEIYICPKSVAHEVGGREFDFYPISVKQLFKLRNLAKPVATALSVIFDDRSKDVTTASMASDDGAFQNKSVGIDPALAAQRSADRARAIGTLIEAICDEKNMSILGLVILDSLRDPDEKPIAASAVDPFLEKLRGPALIQFLIGVGKANVGVFGAAGERLTSLAKDVLEKGATEVVGSVEEAASPESPPEKAGESSKTPSPE